MTPIGINPAQQRTALLLGEEAMRCIHDARVAVFGVGGVGSWCVEALARAGVGEMLLVDSDSVDVTNINRQLPATYETTGQPKVTLMAKRVHSINPACRVSTFCGVYSRENAHLFDLSRFDVVVDAIDSVDSKAALIVNATRTRGVRLVSSMGAALKKDILKIKTAKFRDVTGDALARALRQRFRRLGTFPARPFLCVYSQEYVPNALDLPASETPNGKKRTNGTLVTTTAAFGLVLAQLAIDSLANKAK